MELTRILDTLRDADGNAAAGKLVISNPAFIAADGTAVAAGTMTYLIPQTPGGVVDLQLVPTEDASPLGARYSVEYFLKSGATYLETWQIPRIGPVTVSQARAG